MVDVNSVNGFILLEKSIVFLSIELITRMNAVRTPVAPVQSIFEYRDRIGMFRDIV